MKQKNKRLAFFIIIFVVAVGSFFIAMKNIKPEQTHVTKVISAE